MYSTLYSSELATAIDTAIATELHATDDEYAFAEESVFANRKTPAEHIADNDDIKLSRPIIERTAKSEITKLYLALVSNKISRTEYCKAVKVWADALNNAKEKNIYTVVAFLR